MSGINDLAKRVKDGDIEAANQLMLQLEVWVRQRVARRLFNAEAIDDVTQITFIEAFKHMHRYDTQLDFRKWIGGIAHFQALKYLEKWSTQKKHESAWSLLHINRCELEKEDVQDDPRHDHLQDCLDQLKTKKREHFELFKAKYLDKKSLKQLADLASASIASIGMKLKRIREQLKDCIESKV